MRICINMLVNDNEYGAPWNDQFYWVTMEDFDGKQFRDLLTLSGPDNYTDKELIKAAKGMFPEYDIIKVEKYEICR